MKYRNPTRRIRIARLWLSESQAYEAWWGTYELCNHVVVSRWSDGQLVGVYPVDVAWYQGQTFDSFQGWIMAFLKKVAAGDQKTAGVPSSAGEKWARDYPALWEYLTAEEYEDKSPRKTSTMLLFLEEGIVKACLNDRDQERSLWVSGPSVPDLLKSLDAILRAGEGEWRANRPWDGKRRQKRS